MKMKTLLLLLVVLSAALLLFACTASEDAAPEDVPAADDGVDTTLPEVEPEVEVAPSAPVEPRVDTEVDTSAAATIYVRGADGYSPDAVTVQVGQSVQFINDNDPEANRGDRHLSLLIEHVAKKDAASITDASTSYSTVELPEFDVGEFHTHTFEEAGTYEVWTLRYYDSPRAVITVE